MTVLSFFVMAEGLYPLTRCAISRIVSGVVPQQPPTMRTPLRTASETISANRCGEMS